MNVRSRAVLFSFLAAAVPPSLLTAQIHVESPAPRFELDSRRFFAGDPPAVSKADGRLLLSTGRATIEFWAEPGWSVDGNEDVEPMFCVFYVAAERKVPAPEGASAAEPVASGDPAADAPAGDPAAATAPTTIPVLWPRFAIYLGDTRLSLQTGDRLYTVALSPQIRTKLTNHEKVYFVVTLKDGRAVVFADGGVLAQFAIQLDAMTEPDAQTSGAVKALPPMPGPGWRLCVGGLGEARLGVVTPIQTTRNMRKGDPLDLDECARDFQGTLGGIRIWNAALDESQLLAEKGATPVVLQRGATDLQRSLAFKDPRGSGKEPNYGQLVLFSDFTRESNPKKPGDLLFESPTQDGLVLQFPFSGHWVNTSRKRVKPLLEAPPGLDNAYGNVDAYPLITIFPSGDPDAWIVYQDASLSGLIVRNPAKGGRWEYTEDAEGRPNTGIVVTIKDDRLEFDTSESGFAQRILGGDRGGATARIQLERPNADGWTGSFVEATNGFYTAGLIRYTKTAYRAFDLSRMNFQLAFMEEGTGSSRFLFAPPDPLKQMFDGDAGGTIIPYGFRYEPVEQGVANHVAVMASNATQWAQANSTSVGTSTEWQACDFVANIMNGQAPGAAGLVQRGVNGEPIAQGDTTKDKVKDIAQVFGAGQQSQTKSSTTKEWSHKEGEASKKHSWMLTRAFTRDFNLTQNKSELRLSNEFVREMERLADVSTDTPADLNKECAKFVQQWGTHYALSVTYGAMMISERTVDERERFELETRGKSVETEEKKKYEVKIPAIGGFVPETNIYKDENGWTKGSDSSSTSGGRNGESYSQESVRYIPTGKELVNPGQGMKYEYPVPLFYDLRPISQLLSPAYFDDPRIFHDVREALHRQIKKYLRDRSPEPTQEEEESWLRIADKKLEIWAVDQKWEQIDFDVSSPVTRDSVGWGTENLATEVREPLSGIASLGFDLQVPGAIGFRGGSPSTAVVWRESSPTDPLLTLTTVVPPANAEDRQPSVNYGDMGATKLALRGEMPTDGYKVSLSHVYLGDGPIFDSRSTVAAPGTRVVGRTEFFARELMGTTQPQLKAAAGTGEMTLTAERSATKTIEAFLRVEDQPVPQASASGGFRPTEIVRLVGKGKLTVQLTARLSETYREFPTARVSRDSLAVLRARINETASASAGAFKRPVLGLRIETRPVPTYTEPTTEPVLNPGESTVTDDGIVQCAWAPDPTAAVGYVVARRSKDTRITDYLTTEGTLLTDSPGGGDYSYSVYRQARGLIAPTETPLAAFEVHVPGPVGPRTDVPPMNAPLPAGQAPLSLTASRAQRSGVICETSADGSATLSWQPVERATGYRVVRRQIGGERDAPSIDEDVQTRSIVVRPPPGRSLYSVFAILDGRPASMVGRSPLLLAESAATRPQQPEQPEQPAQPEPSPAPADPVARLATVEAPDGKVRLQWPSVPGAQRYVVRRMLRRDAIDLEATTNELTDEPGPGIYRYAVLPVVDGVVAPTAHKTFRVLVGR